MEFSDFAVINPLVFRELSKDACECLRMYDTNLFVVQFEADSLLEHVLDFIVRDFQVCDYSLDGIPIARKGPSPWINSGHASVTTTRTQSVARR